MQILTLGSGKGGVGKSLIAANLSIAIAQAGKNVVLVDLDLGGSNVHTILGFRSLAEGIGTYLSNTKLPFENIVLPTPYSGLRFIPGDAEIPGLANIKSFQKKKLMRKIFSLKADFVIIDLGAGTSYNILDFFLMSSAGLIVATPSLISILNAYLFLKNSVFRLMYSLFPKDSASYKHLEEMRREGSTLQKIYIPHILEWVKQMEPAIHRDFQDRISRFRPRLILNMLEDPKDDEKSKKLRRSVQEYLGLTMEHLGVIYRDDLQSIALNSRLPIIKYKPSSVLSQAIYRISDKLIQSEIEEEGFIDIADAEESFQTAALEAESDFQAKLYNLEELLHTGTLTTGDLVETIKSQHFELSQLKKENQLLKTKLARAIKQGYKP
ncbi:MAG TPA: MinD/ParA family protein [Spirochaetales bacterium]|nr:MinD/ParA family protein [Spirochaetales bacterium]